MTAETQALIIDLVEWIAQAPRPYAEAMEAWRTSCPRLTVWEDAVDQNYITRRHVEGVGTMISATPRGLDLLRQAGRPAQAAAS